jgi:hypothetical protein
VSREEMMMEVRERRDMVRAGLTRRSVKGEVRMGSWYSRMQKNKLDTGSSVCVIASIAGRQAQIYECNENLQDSRMRRPGCTCRDWSVCKAW